MSKEANQEQPEENVNLVAPIESAKGEPCWNCGEATREGKCPQCGFDKALLYNLDLETAKAAERQKQEKK